MVLMTTIGTLGAMTNGVTMEAKRIMVITISVRLM